MTAPDRIWVDGDTWFSKPVTYPDATEYLRADVVAARLSDPVAVHANMLRGTIAKPTVEQIIHLYGVDALYRELSRRSAGDLPINVRFTWAKDDEEFWLHVTLPDGKSAGINLGNPKGMIATACLRALTTKDQTND